MDFTKIKTSKLGGKDYRAEYVSCLEKILEEKMAKSLSTREEFVNPKKMAENREEYRKKYYDMLGWPLNEFTHNFKPNFEKKLVEELDFIKIYRLRIETLPGLWFGGLIYEPESAGKKAPLVILNPGGGYCAEELMANGKYEAGQIKNIGGRFLREGAIVYAPQLLLWDSTVEPPMEQPGFRQLMDIRLKAMGGSIAAVEIFNIRRAIDYFIGNEDIDENKIGMAGLSYGGFYTLYTTAADTRIKAAFSSCFCCDRFGMDNKQEECRVDWMWQNSAHTFFDAEVAGLIAPRALYLEGTDEDMFPKDLVMREHERAKCFFKAAGAENNIKTTIECGKHEIVNAKAGAEFVLEHLMIKE